MCQNNCNTKREKGEHLSYEDRVKIEHLYNQQDKNYTEIGKELNCHRTTVSREIKKGEIELKNSDWTYRKEYSSKRGQEVYE
ncbi:helix-turn-helix domain-containing protein, partial [Halanaerobium salsuginis]